MSKSKTYVFLMLVCLSAIGFDCVDAFDDPTISATEKLRRDQEAVSGRYARFERLLSQMADMLGHEDPERAELLRRAISKGREHAISANLDEIARSLGTGDFGPAAEKQVGVTDSLRTLLKLLQSEDRRSAVEKDRERLNKLLKDVHNTMTDQRGARSVTQNSKAPSNAAPEQQRAADHAEQILKEMKQHDDAQAGEAQSENGKADPDGKLADPENPSSGAGDKPEGDPAKDAKASPNDDTQSDQNPGNQKEPPSHPSEESSSENPSDSDSKSQKQNQGGSGESSQSQDSEQSEQTPGREQMEAARNLMQEALEQLKQQQREKAVDKQDQTIAELQKAANELEEMLRQLREEEKEMILAALEARFQRMLALQTQIYEGTLDLAATPRKEWTDNAVSLCRDLSQQQAELSQDCSQTTGLLREDGTSVSILVAVEDIEFDMGSVAARLQNTKVSLLTQTMQTDVIEALKELIEATQREMEEMKSEERQQQQQSQSRKKPPLVELMAEIRVLRSLQLRVNRRTRQINELLRGSSSEDDDDLLPQLGELAERQDRLRESARELAKRMEQQR